VLEESRSEKSRASGTQSAGGQLDIEGIHQRRYTGISGGKISIPPLKSPHNEIDKGRTTTLLITSEFERPMVLSYRGSPNTSLLDQELSTSLKVGEREEKSDGGPEKDLLDSIIEKQSKKLVEEKEEVKKLTKEICDESTSKVNTQCNLIEIW